MRPNPSILIGIGLWLSPAAATAASPAAADPIAEPPAAEAPTADESADEARFPFRLGPQDAAWAASAASLHVWAQARYYDMRPVRPSELDPAALTALDRWAAGTYSGAAALASDVLLLPALAVPLALSALDARARGRWSELAVDAVIYAEALAVSSSLNLLVRSSRVHPRPLVYGDEAPESEKAKGEASGSFYSGHANAAFLAAAYLGYTYPLRHPGYAHAAWLRAGAFGYAAVVAGLRVSAGKHFPTDVLAGAAAGTFFGWLLPRLHRVGGAPGEGSGAPGDEAPRLGLQVLPLPDGVLARLACRF